MVWKADRFSLPPGVAGLLLVGQVVAIGAPSIQERIDAAEPGATVIIEAGHYREDIVIDKALHLRGEGTPHIEGSGSGRVVQILAPDVTLDGFRISHSGLNLSRDDAAIHIQADGAVIENNQIHDSLHGIYVHGASGVRVERNRIRGIEETLLENLGGRAAPVGDGDLCRVSQDRRGNGLHFWNSQENRVVANEISGTRDGIYFSFTRQSHIERNRVNGCRYGLHYMYSDENDVVENVFEQNVAGAALMFSKGVTVRANHFINNHGPRAYGIAMHNVDMSMFSENRLTGNRIGLYLQNSHVNEFSQNLLDRNYIGLRLTSSSTNNSFAANEIGRNLHNIDLAGRENSNQWNKDNRGNRWASAMTLDLTGDGVSELPHHEIDLFGRVREDFPFIGFLTGSPALRVVANALGRAPPPGTNFVTDPHPLTGPVNLSRSFSQGRHGEEKHSYD
jgi:nitrous oxidase accessory protein